MSRVTPVIDSADSAENVSVGPNYELGRAWLGAPSLRDNRVPEPRLQEGKRRSPARGDRRRAELWQLSAHALLQGARYGSGRCSHSTDGQSSRGTGDSAALGPTPTHSRGCRGYGKVRTEPGPARVDLYSCCASSLSCLSVSTTHGRSLRWGPRHGPASVQVAQQRTRPS